MVRTFLSYLCRISAKAVSAVTKLYCMDDKVGPVTQVPDNSTANVSWQRPNSACHYTRIGVEGCTGISNLDVTQTLDVILTFQRSMAFRASAEINDPS